MTMVSVPLLAVMVVAQLVLLLIVYVISKE